MFNKPTSDLLALKHFQPNPIFKSKTEAETGSLSKRLCLAPALGVTKCIIFTDVYWSHIVALLESHLDVQQTHLRPFST
jgi:hypothetical protein